MTQKDFHHKTNIELVPNCEENDTFSPPLNTALWEHKMIRILYIRTAIAMCSHDSRLKHDQNHGSEKIERVQGL